VRFTLWLFGAEVLAVEIGPADQSEHADLIETTQHLDASDTDRHMGVGFKSEE